jgi:Flp pilus assembly protein TadG
MLNFVKDGTAIEKGSLAVPVNRLFEDLLRDRCGATAVEFALLAPVLTVMLLGIVDFGNLAYAQMQVATSAQAGADYALHNGFNATAIQTAVTSATSRTVTASPAPAQVTGCVTNNVLVTTTGTSCPSGGSPGTYVVVNATSTFTPLVTFKTYNGHRWQAFSLPTSLTAKAAIRIS